MWLFVEAGDDQAGRRKLIDEFILGLYQLGIQIDREQELVP